MKFTGHLDPAQLSGLDWRSDDLMSICVQYFFFFFKAKFLYRYIYLLAVLCLICCIGFALVVASRGYSLMVLASLVEHGL